MSAHTPGPWRAGGYTSGPLLVTGAPDAETPYPGRPVVCNVGIGTNPRHQADARLIAAAPEMLEVLRAAMARQWALQTHLHHGVNCRSTLPVSSGKRKRCDCGFDEALGVSPGIDERARALLARVEGKS